MLGLIIKSKKVAEQSLFRIDSWFKRVFKEQAGGAELIATLVIVGIVVILAFTFKDALSGLVEDLWNGLLRDKNEDPEIKGFDEYGE